MIQLIGAPGSAYVRKVRLCLVEKGIPFQSKPVSPMQPLPSDFYSISPLGKIPVLVDDGFAIADSSVICAYLEKAYPEVSLYPHQPKQLAQALWLEEYADTALFKAIAPCYYQTILVPLYKQQQPDLAQIDRALTELLPPVATYLEQVIQDKSFLIQHQLSIADISIGSVFFNMYASGYAVDKKQWPHLAAYLQQLLQRQSFMACMADIEAERARTTGAYV